MLTSGVDIFRWSGSTPVGVDAAAVTAAVAASEHGTNNTVGLLIAAGGGALRALRADEGLHGSDQSAGQDGR